MDKSNITIQSILIHSSLFYYSFMLLSSSKSPNWCKNQPHILKSLWGWFSTILSHAEFEECRGRNNSSRLPQLKGLHLHYVKRHNVILYKDILSQKNFIRLWVHTILSEIESQFQCLAFEWRDGLIPRTWQRRQATIRRNEY